MTLLYQLKPLFGAERDDRMILNIEIELKGKLLVTLSLNETPAS
jgi:hypothetical protein